jgi:hypothetical protein
LHPQSQRYAQLLAIRVRQLGEDFHVHVVRGERIGVVAESERLEPAVGVVHGDDPAAACPATIRRR